MHLSRVGNRLKEGHTGRHLEGGQDTFPTNHLLRRELYHIQRELLRERTRCKALEEELENPMNIHRWRKLEVGVASGHVISHQWPPAMVFIGKRSEYL